MAPSRSGWIPTHPKVRGAPRAIYTVVSADIAARSLPLCATRHWPLACVKLLLEQIKGRHGLPGQRTGLPGLACFGGDLAKLCNARLASSGGAQRVTSVVCSPPSNVPFSHVADQLPSTSTTVSCAMPAMVTITAAPAWPVPVTVTPPSKPWALEKPSSAGLLLLPIVENPARSIAPRICLAMSLHFCESEQKIRMIFPKRPSSTKSGGGP